MNRQWMWCSGLACSLAMANGAFAQDWPQWRGPNRDARVSGFEAPETWPDLLKKEWSVTVGDGVASPALVGERLYVNYREDGKETARCLDAATGKEIWRFDVPAEARRGADGGFPGPRATPAVADGKMAILGVHGTLRCLDAETGKLLWENAEFEGDIPRFATSSSPIVVDGLCVAQLGSEERGALVAFDLNTGEERWRLAGEAPAYASPALIALDGKQAIVTPTDRSLIAVDAASGKLLWKIDYLQGRYNAASPIVEGDELVYAGPTRGLTAVSLVSKDEAIDAKELWKSPEATVQFNTPVKRENLIFGLSNAGQVFCVDAETGEMKWTAPLSEETPSAESERPAGERPEGTPRRENSGERTEQPGQRSEGQRPEGRPDGRPGFGDRGPGGPGGPGGRFGGGARRGGGGRGGYGSIVDAGSALFALTPNGKLIAFEPTAEAYKPLATYQVAQEGTYAYPIVAGKRIYVKDQNDLTLWTLP
ncbi:MAG TPA: PQQ-binding-like beta-propeller repeat protein [Pirellulaceae bacterium]|jgi:outer membrane protein assembly factor BamB|nr:PQQ-binding-like beta-propeller repeat protein [Pirellulaceae bacterium]